MRSSLLFCVLLACGSEDTLPASADATACVDITDTELLDAAMERAEAKPIELGQGYQVNIFPDTAGFLVFTLAEASTVTVFSDNLGTLSAHWQGDDVTLVAEGSQLDQCPNTIPEFHTLDLPAGDTTLELGPVFQASVRVLVALGEVTGPQ